MKKKYNAFLFIYLFFAGTALGIALVSITMGFNYRAIDSILMTWLCLITAIVIGKND